MTGSRLRRLALWLCLLLLPLLFYHQLAFSGMIFARGDAYNYFYPYWDARNEAFRAGQLPQWTNDLFMGVPLLANPQLGSYYPPNWLTAPLRAPDAIAISILLHAALAGLGMAWLYRQAESKAALPALTAGVVFAFGGVLTSHVEQINQLQGLAWMPLLFALFHRLLARGNAWRAGLLLAAAWALQIFSGHTQTVFISGVGLGVYALAQASGGWRGRIVALLKLAGAFALALALAIPQLLPSLELMGMSNRGGGFNLQEATAFSLPLSLLGRALLPSYDGQLFGEYVAYVGVIGMGLALFAARRCAWTLLAALGLALALGRYNPLYLLLGELPGFDLFRVPARFLALYSLGMALLAGRGVAALSRPPSVPPSSRGEGKPPSVPPSSRGEGSPPSRGLRKLTVAAALLLLILTTRFLLEPSPLDFLGDPGISLRGLGMWLGAWILLLALLHVRRRGTPACATKSCDSPPPSHQPMGTGEPVARPASKDCEYWSSGRPNGSPLQPNSSLYSSHSPNSVVKFWNYLPALTPLLACLLVIAELLLAAQSLPDKDLAPPDVYLGQRFTISQLQALQAGEVAPGRVLSISQLYFDPGDLAALRQRFDRLGMDANAQTQALDAIKKQEMLMPNQSLAWGIPSLDGFGGGITPTEAHTQFTSLLLPAGAPRTGDGRLGERLAQSECRGACLPELRWLQLSHVRYLITDKIHDVWHEGVAYDTTLSRYWRDVEALALPAYTDEVRILHSQPLPGAQPLPDGSWLTVADAESLSRILAQDSGIIAVTAVNSRHASIFTQLQPPGFARVLSSDIEIYTLPRGQRAYLASNPHYLPDDWQGREDALDWLRGNDGSVIHGAPALPKTDVSGGQVTIRDYSDTRADLLVDSPAPAWLMLADAFYPGWTASVNGKPATIYRANVMFRALQVPAGESAVALQFQPTLWRNALILGLAIWGIVGAVWLWLRSVQATLPE